MIALPITQRQREMPAVDVIREVVKQLNDDDPASVRAAAALGRLVYVNGLLIRALRQSREAMLMGSDMPGVTAPAILALNAALAEAGAA